MKRWEEFINGTTGLSYFKIFLLLVFLLSIVFAFQFFTKSNVVSYEELHTYMKEFELQYGLLVNENQGCLIGRKLTTYDYPTSVRGVISRTHGAAVFLNFSMKKSNEAEILEISQPIEYYIWPDMRKEISFSWDDIPGKDNLRLIEFLSNIGIDWAKTAKIVKIDDGKTLRVTNGENFLSLRLNDERNKITLEKSDGSPVVFTNGQRVAFFVIRENGKLNIYEWISILISPGDYNLNGSVNAANGFILIDPGATIRYYGEGNAFNISDKARIAIFGNLIYQYRMILKGTNNKDDWSTLHARQDALSEFIWTCKDNSNPSMNATMIEKIDSKYKLSILKDKIALRMESGLYKDNPSIFTDDFEDLRKNQGSEEDLNVILTNYYNLQTNEAKTLSKKFSDLWETYMVPIITAIIGGIFVLYFEIRMKR